MANLSSPLIVLFLLLASTSLASRKGTILKLDIEKKLSGIPSSDPDVELPSSSDPEVVLNEDDAGRRTVKESTPGVEESPPSGRGLRIGPKDKPALKEPLYKAIVIEDTPGGWGYGWDDGDGEVGAVDEINGDISWGWKDEEKHHGWKHGDDEEEHHGWKHEMDQHHGWHHDHKHGHHHKHGHQHKHGHKHGHKHDHDHKHKHGHHHKHGHKHGHKHEHEHKHGHKHKHGHHHHHKHEHHHHHHHHHGHKHGHHHGHKHHGWGEDDERR